MVRHKRKYRRLIAILIVLFAAIFLISLPRTLTFIVAFNDVKGHASDFEKLAKGTHRAAIVPGAGLVNRRPSPVLEDRVKAAIRLLEANRVDVIIMSGDNTTQYYDEPTAMRTHAIRLGAAPEKVAIDYGGRRTWDTCMRAHTIFGVDEAIIVTTSFHIDRAVVTCQAAGIETQGYSVSDSAYGIKHRIRWRAREFAATARALADVWWVKPEPAVKGDPIDPWDPCEIQRSLAPSDAQLDAERTQLNCAT